MRTKNAKRLWPVPVTLGVMALAALLAFGLLATTGAQPASADHPGETVTAPTDSGMCHVNVTSTTRTGGGTCTTAASSVNVVLQNTGSNTAQAVVYVTGGSDINAQAMEGTDKAGKKGLAEYLFTGANGIPEQIPDAAAEGGQAPGTKTITVTDSMASNGHVFLFVYSGGDLTNSDDVPLEDETTELNVESSSTPDTDVTNVIEVIFLGPPAEYNKKDMTGFKIDGINNINTDGDTGTVAPMVDVQDADGHPLTGTLVLTIDDPDGKAKFARNGTNNDTFAIVNGEVDAGTINGLPKGSSAVKMPVMATVTASGATVEFTSYITRVGPSATITSNTYICDMAKAGAIDGDDTNSIEAGEYCLAEARALEDDDVKDPSPVAVFSPGSVVLVHSTAVDELEQDVADTVTFTVEEKLDDDEDASFEATDIAQVLANTNTGEEAVAHNRIHIPTADDIETGTYDFDVDANDGDGTGSLEITVSGPPMDYEITGEMWIPLGGEKTYTVTATDENMNIPAAVAADYMAGGDYAITVRVRGTGTKQDEDVVGLSSTGLLTVSAGKGTGTFTILAPVGASQGDSVTIRVLVNDTVEATMKVYFGDDPTPPATHESLVTASDAAAGTATIMWQPITGATSYHVAVITDDGNYTLVSGTYMEITDVSDREHMFTGLTSGTAYIFAVIGEMADGTYSGLAFERMTLE